MRTSPLSLHDAPNPLQNTDEFVKQGEIKAWEITSFSSHFRFGGKDARVLTDNEIKTTKLVNQALEPVSCEPLNIFNLY